MDLIDHEVASERRYRDLKSSLNELKSNPYKETEMSTQPNYFESGNNSGANWGAGAAGGVIGYMLGQNGGFGGGNREPSVTPDQMDSRFNNLQSQMNTDALQGHLGRIQGQIANTGADSTIALGAAITGVKDSVVASSAHSQLALCGLGHTVQAGFAGVNQNILLQGAASRELALQQALDAERARATELRIALSEHKNQSGHSATQVLVQQLVNQGNV